MNKLLIATTNRGKIEQIKPILKDLPIELIFLPDLNLKLTAEENGKTLEENAVIKANFYSDLTGLWALADDMGLEIDALGGEPGVKSRRWPGHEASDEELIRLTLKKLKGVPFEKRKASFKSVIAIASPQKENWILKGVSRGYISESPSRIKIKGLPFACLFFIPKYKKIFTELSDIEKEKTGHRIKAIKKAKKIIKEILC
jgi:XTP/dITP diphosphohydrolase